MVQREMGCRWATYEIKLSYFMLLILVPEFQGCFSLNSEGLTLLEFRSRVTSDPFGALVNWNVDDKDPCLWSGVHCVDGEVQTLDLNGLCLGGVLGPELGYLAHLKFLLLNGNHFCGVIPKQLGRLSVLKVLDLRNNSLSGTIPAEIGWMHSLKRLLLSNNKFEGIIPLEIVQLDRLTDMQFDMNLTPEVSCINRKVGHCEWSSNLKSMRKADSILTPIKETINHYFDLLPVFGKGSFEIDAGHSYENRPSLSKPRFIRNKHNVADITRRKLVEQSSNLAAVPYNGGILLNNSFSTPSNIGSGSFPAVPKEKNTSSSQSTTTSGLSSSSANQPPNHLAPTSGHSEHTWKYILGISCGGFLLFAVAAMLVVVYGRAARNIRPWKSGLSGQLQKAFITGVPKLNSSELETACEDFSNIIVTHDAVTLYKGTLSSGVEIAVASTVIASLKDWTKHAEVAFRKKIAAMSRLNHKNYVNLIGYCEENEPFVRMMVFEYAPNGSLFEHLHVKELEHLDWSARMRIIMGVGYCLQHMHALDPPLSHSDLTSKAIYLTDDYAAKIADVAFWAELVKKSKISMENDSKHHELSSLEDPEHDVYCFGILLFEIISAKHPHSNDRESIVNWAKEYLADKQHSNHLIDPTLTSFKNNDLEIICEVIQECTQQDLSKRPTMKEVMSKLRDALDISPESATPRLSPLWWAELEILSSETT